MIKLIVLCALIALCMARSLNDDVPETLINKDDIEAESGISELTKQKDVGVEESPKESDVHTLLGNIESIESDVREKDGANPDSKGLFFNRLTTSTSAPFLTLSLSLNTDGLPQGMTMISQK